MRLGFWVVVLLGIFAWAPATYPGYWQGLDGFVPIFNVMRAAPLAQVGTTPDLWRGIGGDTFLLAGPLGLLGSDPTTIVRITFIIAFLLAGLGTYVWLQAYLGDRAAGLAGLSYMLFPPLLATVYVRGSLSDALIAGLLPMALAGIAAQSTGRSPSAAAVTVIAIVWMWRAQAGLALLATVLLFSYALLVERNRLSCLVVAVSGAAGVLSLLPVWTIRGPAAVPFADHFVYVHQLFAVDWQVAPSIAGPWDGFPFQLGIITVVFTLVSLWQWWIAARQTGHSPVAARLLVFGFLGALVMISLSLGWSAPLWQWTGASALLTYPWQIMLLAGPLLALTVGALPALNADLRSAPYWAALVALVVIGNYRYVTSDFTQTPARETPVAVFGPAHNLVVLDANLHESDHPRSAQLQITWQSLHPLDFDYNIFLQAVTGDESALAVVAQLDVQPLTSEHPATAWRPGEILSTTYQLDLSAVAATSDLRYFFGYYDWRDGRRLPRDGGIDDKLVFYGQ